MLLDLDIARLIVWHTDYVDAPHHNISQESTCHAQGAQLTCCVVCKRDVSAESERCGSVAEDQHPGNDPVEVCWRVEDAVAGKVGICSICWLTYSTRTDIPVPVAVYT